MSRVRSPEHKPGISVGVQFDVEVGCKVPAAQRTIKPDMSSLDAHIIQTRISIPTQFRIRQAQEIVVTVNPLAIDAEPLTCITDSQWLVVVHLVLRWSFY